MNKSEEISHATADADPRVPGEVPDTSSEGIKMRTLNRDSEEFVRHYCLLIERTDRDPGRFAGALNENPELARSIVRLYKILQRLEQRGGRNLFVDQAHPKFLTAVRDFRKRWLDAYDEFRVQNYKQAAVRVCEEFMRCYGLLVEHTGDDPAAVESVRKDSPNWTAQSRGCAKSLPLWESLKVTVGEKNERGSLLPRPER